MSENPLVSIITTYYNSVSLGDFVNTSMQCLLNQTYKNIEFICVNDGSTDDTLQQLNDYAARDSRIKVYTKDNQKYAQYSKGYGQDKAEGEFIFLFDHDDLVETDAIEKALKTFQERPNLDIVSFLIKTMYTDGKLKYFSNVNLLIKDPSEFSAVEISGIEALKLTVGRYDIHIRGLYRSRVFKTSSFNFTEALLNADEIVERLILENAKLIGSCDAVYTHYIHPDSSAKLPSIKKIDIVRTDVLLREIFKSKNIYDARKDIFELTAYKNYVNAVKIFHYFSGKLSREEQAFQKKRLIESYTGLDKKIILNQYQGLAKLYNRLLLNSFNINFNLYKLKN